MDPKVKSIFWSDDAVGDLTAEQTFAFLWLITNERTNNIGYCEVSKRQFKNDTKMPLEELQGLLKAHARAFVWEEHNGQLRVWIRSFIRHQWSPGELKPTSRLYPNLQKLAEALPESFQKALASSYPALCKPLEGGKALARGQHSTEQHSTEQSTGGAGGAGQDSQPSAEVPTEAEVLTYAMEWAGDTARAIPASMPEPWVLSWLAWRMEPKAGPFPADWRADLVRRFTADWVAGRKNTRPTKNKKTAPLAAGGDIDAQVALQVEITSLQAELQWQDDPARRAEIKTRLTELGVRE